LRYLVTPSAYKGSFTPSEIACAISDGIQRFDSAGEVVLAPIADGGDGTIEALQIGTGGTIHKIDVHGPVGDLVTASWLEIEAENVPKTDDDFSFAHPDDEKAQSPLAVVELASACGLAYVSKPDRVSALNANTAGAGEVIQECYERGFRNIVLAVGGSASTDGGMGILSALGAVFFDNKGNRLRPNGGNLHEIASIDLTGLSRWKSELKLRVATDVINPLLGDEGAARIFAPQKGASSADVEHLDRGLRHYADLLEKSTGKLARNLLGAGAAGGVPFGLAIGLDAQIIPGFRWIANVLNLESKIRMSDIVISAEGKLDTQSISGKAAGELAGMCKQFEKRFWMIPAIVETGVDWPMLGVERVEPSAQPNSLASLEDVSNAAFQLCRKAVL
jgi:glycerate kinase